jgi:hypothetical protein
MNKPKTVIICTLVGVLLVLPVAGALYAWSLASRLSGAVAIVSKGPEIEAFLQKPGASYVQANFRFPEGLGDDVIFGVDQELIEGTEKPIYVKGGDWMGLVGLQRTGNVWVASGTDDTMNGKPSHDRAWKILTLDQPLQPNTWYRIRCSADFGKRIFNKLEIEGPGLNKMLDLTDYKLDYPNYMPFDGSAMSYYVFAMRGRSMMKKKGTPLVYFDNVEGGIESNGTNTVVFKSDFEDQTVVDKQPVTLPVIKLDGYKQNHFYLERDEAKFRIEKNKFALSGQSVGVADVDLDSFADLVE